jgi:hypothetical protein
MITFNHIRLFGPRHLRIYFNIFQYIFKIIQVVEFKCMLIYYNNSHELKDTGIEANPFEGGHVIKSLLPALHTSSMRKP